MTQQIAIIPQPVHCELKSGAFRWTAETAVTTDSANVENGSYLRGLTSPASAATTSVNNLSTSIHLTLGGDETHLGSEGYELSVSKERITITALTTTGVFYGIQTLRQLLPVGQAAGEIPCLAIEDKPRFPWRGFMLDEGRHFQGKETVLRLLDAMALLKLNTFLQDILDEVMDLFPGPYIHIGGDEAPRARWKRCPDCQGRIAQEGLADEHDLQLYLTNRIAQYLAENGRTLVGWNEILNDKLVPSAIAQYWLRNRKGMIAAIENGRRAILSPNWHYYLDYSYSLTALSKTYNHEPLFNELSDDAVKNVLGIESPLWTEFVPARERLGYQTFPRLTAVAESAWSPPEQKDLQSFRQRLPHFLIHLDQIGLGYAPLSEIEPSKIKQKLGIFTFMRP
jgi:N-acetyl-beta-hexosaminidase